MRGRGRRYGWGIELILFYGLALLFFTAFCHPCLLTVALLLFQSFSLFPFLLLSRPLSISSKAFLLAGVIYLSALARSFPQARVKDQTRYHLDRTISLSFFLFVPTTVFAFFPRLSPDPRCITRFPLSHFICRSLDGERWFFRIEGGKNRHSPIVTGG